MFKSFLGPPPVGCRGPCAFSGGFLGVLIGLSFGKLPILCMFCVKKKQRLGLLFQRDSLHIFVVFLCCGVLGQICFFNFTLVASFGQIRAILLVVLSKLQVMC